MKSLQRTSLALLGILFVAAYSTARGEDTTIEIKRVPSGELQPAYFSVTHNLSVQIEAVGAGWEGGDHMFAYPWIIDAQKRTMVWSMDEEINERVKGSKWLRRYSDQVDLKPGTYELYFYAGRPGFLDGGAGFENLSEMLRALGRWLEDHRKDLGDSRIDPEFTEKCLVRVTGNAGSLSPVAKPVFPEPVVSLLHPGDNAYLSKGFSLTSDGDFEVYAVGEYSGAGERMVDWGWIIDARTRGRVWEMDDKNTDWAGGADKNRRFKDRVHFRAGDYIAYYVSDDSHSPEGWNSDPPYDPDAWGLQIIPVLASDRVKVRSFTESRQPTAIVRLVGIGDNELKSAAFHLTRPAHLRIYAIGEDDRFGDRMADCAWIVRSDRTARVWSMTSGNTQPAGGADKNRLFDGVVTLDPGDYTVYYASDGSHSYRGGWNSAPPFDQKSYGVTVYPADSGVSAVEVIPVTQGSVPKANLLAEIAAVHSDADRKATFSLTSPTRVHIHAVGEGTRSGMADYGWIENELTGDIVWEMTYRKTVHAGGADKNRAVDQTILLDKGNYVVHYVTDGSHAFGDWNDSPPDDPASWGITVTRAERGGE